MSKIVCVTSIPSIGCTFIDWSIHYLSGQTQYYSIQDQAWIPLSDNPVTSLNAHGHRKNHPGGLEETAQAIEQFHRLPGNNLFSFYPIRIRPYKVERMLGINAVTNSEEFKQIEEYQRKDYQQLLNYCNSQDVPVTYVELDPADILYIPEIRYRERLVDGQLYALSEDDYQNEMDSVFFKQSVDSWEQSNLTEIWDIREQQALRCRPFNKSVIDYNLQFDFDHLWLDARSFWYHGGRAIKQIMDYFELTIDPVRMSKWHDIYKAWQALHVSRQEFIYNCDHIVKAIVNNWSYELPELSFTQEVIIQHCLIYQFGLNLKTWQLSKFPKNTQDLHKLLETNIHPIKNF